MEIVQCDSCGMRVFPKADNSCPSCGHSFGPLPDIEADEVSQNTDLPQDELSSISETKTTPIETLTRAQQDSSIIVTEPLSHTRDSIRKSIQTLQWSALLAWAVVIIGGNLGVIFSLGFIGIQRDSVRRSLDRTQSLSEDQRSRWRYKANNWVVIGSLPSIIWLAGYLFLEDGFQSLYPW